MQKLSIDVTKIDKSEIFEGKKGKYISLTLFENKGGTDQYGNDGFVIQEISQKRREAGEKGPIIGNWKHHGSKGGWNDRPASEATRQPSGQRPATPTQADDDCSDIPF